MRRIAITLGLAVTGGLVGGVLGAVCLWIVAALRGLVFNGFGDLAILLAGAQGGAILGFVLAPIAAWSLMRYAPLWRAIGEPALGTTLGAIVGSYLGPILKLGLTWGVIGAVTGFLIAAVRLRFAYRKLLSPKEAAAASYEEL